MNKKSPPNVVHKKIKPYPILLNLERLGAVQEPPSPSVSAAPSAPQNGAPSGAMEAMIIRLTSVGFQIDLGPLKLLIGETYRAEFVIPLFNNRIKESIKVVKTYTTFKDAGFKEKVHLAELHFIHPDPLTTAAIDRFEKAIKQK